jgi:hypothetical protein
MNPFGLIPKVAGASSVSYSHEDAANSRKGRLRRSVGRFCHHADPIEVMSISEQAESKEIMAICRMYAIPETERAIFTMVRTAPSVGKGSSG